MDMYRKGGIRGINKVSLRIEFRACFPESSAHPIRESQGVNAVALRQMTNWGSR